MTDAMDAALHPAEKPRDALGELEAFGRKMFACGVLAAGSGAGMPNMPGSLDAPEDERIGLVVLPAARGVLERIGNLSGDTRLKEDRKAAMGLLEECPIRIGSDGALLSVWHATKAAPRLFADWLHEVDGFLEYRAIPERMRGK